MDATADEASPRPRTAARTGPSAAQALPAGLLYRRGVAFVLELTLLQIFVQPVVWWALGDQLAWPLGEGLLGEYRYDLATLVALFPFLLRDLAFAGTSPVKRALGLRVVDVRSDGTRAPSLGQRLLRSVPLLLPGVLWVIEFFVARNDDQLRRLGDHFAHTRVVDERPRLARWHWGWLLLASVAATAVVRMYAPQAAYHWLAVTFG